MKKKILILSMLCFLSLSLFGCGASTQSLVESNLSEVTKIYYMGENDDFYCTLAVGERETTYLMNGHSTEKTEFALLSIVPTQNNYANLIKAKIIIDGQENQVELEINGLNHNYMVDLEKSFSGNEQIEVVFENSKLKLQNVSDDFGVDYLEAIEIASVEMKDQILQKKSYKNLNAECYLRILDKKANDFDGLFWCFTVLNVDNESFSMVFSAEDGEILAKS